MQTEQVNDACWLKDTVFFHVIEKGFQENDQRQQRKLSRVAQYVDYVQRAQQLCFPFLTPCVSA